MRKLLIYMKDYRKESLLGPLFKLLEAALELLVPLVVAAVIDNGIAGDDRGYIVKMCLLLLAIGAAGLGFSVTAQYFAAKASVGFIKKVKHALFRHIQRFSYSDMDTLGTPTLITRMTSDMNQVQSGVNLTLRLLLRSPFVVFGAMVMAFTIDVRAALIFVVTIPVLTVIVFGIMLWSIPLYKKVQAQLDQVLGITRENLSGVRVIRAFCKEETETRRFEAETGRLSVIQRRVGRISALLNPVTFIVINLAIIVLIRTGAVRVNAGLLTQGAVVALYNYMSQILVELIKLADLIISITRTVACGKRIKAVFEIQPEQSSGGSTPVAGAPIAVEFRNVTLRYKNAGDDSLIGISFTANRGETVGVIGPTGCGKTSLVNLIPRFYGATDGAVLVNGINVRDCAVDALRKIIAVVPQKAVLFAGTIRDNMRWGNADATDEEIIDALIVAQAKEIVDGCEGGLDAILEQGGKNLSGGQRQRLTIARALLKKPEILILDDSASALDFATDAALRRSLRELAGKPTVFIVSQRASSVRNADRILVLEDGRLAGAGNHPQLLDDCTVYREIYESQFAKETLHREQGQ